ncbi:dual OB domain-containing protein [Pseudomonas viridiflava]|uniref:dual OB domain-containing protein n=1 Tax=Pseudomonas viridiflava TaxID=33069 RepID=UPI000F03F6EB
MPHTLDMVCLANSWKHGGRCIAGKIYGGDRSGEWIRPVSPTVGHRQITFAQMNYGQNQFANILDVIRIEFTTREPNTFQQENLIISGIRWVKLGKLDPTNLRNWLDAPNALWSNGDDSEYGTNDKISGPIIAETRPSSLVMVQPDGGLLTVTVAKERDDKTKIRLHFRYNRVKYALTTTDIWSQDYFRGCGIGEYELKNIQAMTISLGEPFANGNTTKIVAEIFRG